MSSSNSNDAINVNPREFRSVLFIVWFLIEIQNPWCFQSELIPAISAAICSGR